MLLWPFGTYLKENCDLEGNLGTCWRVEKVQTHSSGVLDTLVYVTGLLAAHVAFLLRRVSGAIALLQAVLQTQGLCTDLQTCKVIYT